MIVLPMYGQTGSPDQKTDTLKNQVSLEIFGTGIKNSIGYERLLVQRPKINLASRIGMGYYPENDETVSIPFEFTAFWGSNKSFIETGLGLTWCKFIKYNTGPRPAVLGDVYSSTIRESQLLYSFRFGYRYQKPNRRNTFRIGITFLFESSDGDISIFYPLFPMGVSYGFRF
jgi:hypothetical protein